MSTPIRFPLSDPGLNPPRRPLSLGVRLGMYSGLLTGLALALGVWGLDAVALRAAHLRLLYPSLALGSLMLLFLGGLAGGLSARIERAAGSLAIWFLAGVLMSLTIGHLPYEGRTLTVWLADWRFWGLLIYPFDASGQARLFMSGFFVALALTVLGVLQPYRLEGIQNACAPDGRLSDRAWFLLILPLPLVLGVGLIAEDIVNRPLRAAPQLVSEAIRVGRDYPGDLFALSLERGVNYNALAGVRGQMGGDYSLQIGETQLEWNTVIIVAHFEGGGWLNCRVIAGQLSHCDDASPPYWKGFAALLAGRGREDCAECAVAVDDDWRAWLRARGGDLGDRPVITRLAQWGSHVLMRAESPDGERSVDCLFAGQYPVRLERCDEGR